MSVIQQIRQRLEPEAIAREVQLTHDRARIQFRLERVTVDSMEEFTAVIGDYYNHHIQQTTGSRLPNFEAQERAKEIVVKVYGSLLSGYDRAHTGLHGGLHKLLDALSDKLKTDASRRYIQNVIDTYVAPNNWEEQKRIVSDLVPLLGMKNDRPAEVYAHDYKAFIESYLELLTEAGKRSSQFPRA